MTLEDLEKRVAYLEKELQVTRDIEAIKQLHYRYYTAFMLAKWDQVLDCFSDDCVLDVMAEPIQGRAEIEKAYKRIAQRHIGKEGDWLVHPIITVDGEKANGNWAQFMMYPYRRNEAAIFWEMGWYNAEYTKIDGQWKISRLNQRFHVSLPWPETLLK
jgi:hypothetical protein